MGRELGLGVIPWSPLGSGVLTGKYTRADLAHEISADPSGTRRNVGRPTDPSPSARSASPRWSSGWPASRE
ncbi:aryl-alcohol dehydrogenase-like predicted oxidoreductase [Nonomuraea thailandensis]|uniref:Aryl-alcohol dehydrogenase-like predicted oxidoreductase n=1 Tax=Nonomuraea thailandensis TaxID=1188745 RepID=A0A9X2GHY5_9ACTN|nr:aryl-alcohol dehydrogenase-like predicted oxidoreductase [Nonomuraea thailandensis]